MDHEPSEFVASETSVTPVVPEVSAPKGDAPVAVGSGRVIAGLASLPGKALVDEKALAHMLGVCPRTVRRMVSHNEVPPPVSFGGRSMWQVERVLQHFEVRADRAAREARRAHDKLKELLPPGRL